MRALTRLQRPLITAVLYRKQKSFQGLCYFSSKTSNYVELRKKEFHVNPGFGTFRTTGNVDCIVRPANPHEYPDADRALVFIYGEESSPSQDISIELTGESKDLLTINAFPSTPKMYCEVHLPIKYDLEVKLLNNAAIQIFGMEADEVNISTATGDINTKGLKSHNIHINTRMGNITAEGTLQGNIFVNAIKTNITAKRLQGMAMSIDVEELNTNIESSYMNQGEITAHRGNINMNNLHGCTDLVLREGNISINGLHGQISGFVGTGNMNVQVTDITSNSTLHVNQGNLSLSVLENLRHNLEVTASSLEVADALKSKGSLSTDTKQTFVVDNKEDSERSTVIATVIKGLAHLNIQDWFSTLGIKIK